MAARQDNDTPWKHALTKHLRDFFAFFFPAIESEIDWSQPAKFLDKELQRIAPRSKTGRGLTDSLVEVHRHGGEAAWVLVHIEVQMQKVRNFAERMLLYHTRIWLHHRRSVCSLAILGDKIEEWKPCVYENSLWGSSLRFEFPVVKLLDYRDGLAELEQTRNPFGVLVVATLHAQAASPSSTGRRIAKRRVVRGWYEAGLSADEIRELFLLLAWVMTLTPDQDDIFQDELYEIERSKNMPFITSVERANMEKGRKVGREEGREEGLHLAISRLLMSRFGDIPADLREAVSSIASVELLAELVVQAGTVETMDQMRDALAGTLRPE